MDGRTDGGITEKIKDLLTLFLISEMVSAASSSFRILDSRSKVFQKEEGGRVYKNVSSFFSVSFFFLRKKLASMLQVALFAAPVFPRGADERAAV